MTSTADPADHAPTPVPTWARVAIYLFGAIVGGSALAASGFDLYGLAVALGFVYGTALALPIGLDAGAVVAGVRWITAPPGSPERARWRNATLGLVAASAVLNGLSVLAAPHWLNGALQPIGDVGLLAGPVAVVIAVVIAAAFPLVAAWMVHAVLEVRDAAARNRKPRAPRQPWVRPLLAAVAVWARERAAESRERRALLAAQRDLLRSPPSPEEPEEPRKTPEEGSGKPEEPGKAPSPPELPAPDLTGHKMNDARAWFRHERRHGRSPSALEVNTRIASEHYVKTRHLEGWQREIDEEAGDHDELEKRRHRAGV